jgi:hypothetical protein
MCFLPLDWTDNTIYWTFPLVSRDYDSLADYCLLTAANMKSCQSCSGFSDGHSPSPGFPNFLTIATLNLLELTNQVKDKVMLKQTVSQPLWFGLKCPICESRRNSYYCQRVPRLLIMGALFEAGNISSSITRPPVDGIRVHKAVPLQWMLYCGIFTQL